MDAASTASVAAVLLKVPAGEAIGGGSPCSLECGSVRGCNLALRATAESVRDLADTQP
jgi:hypothetical protein